VTHVLELFAGEDEALLVGLGETCIPLSFNASLGCLPVKMRRCLSRVDETRILKLFASEYEARKALLVGQRKTRTGADSDVTMTSQREKHLAAAGFIAAADSLPDIESLYYYIKATLFKYTTYKLMSIEEIS
jgi:hypothetical protein